MPDKNILTQNQIQVLQSFFNHTQDFYLTGGTALSAFYFKHRYSVDLDFFTQSDESFDKIINIITRVSKDVNLNFEVIRDTHYFKHINIIESEKKFLTLHFAIDIHHQTEYNKNNFNGIIVDTLKDIFTNKMCAILGRNEIKDLIDLYFFELNNYKILDYFEEAKNKDGGMDFEPFAYCLSCIEIKNFEEMMIKPLTKNELESFKKKYIKIMMEKSYNG